MYQANDVAQYFINHSYNGELDDVTNLKLQKLLYYAQGYSLALLDRPLFDEDIEHWEHGTVVPCVYHEYKQYTNQIIPSNPKFDMTIFSTNSKKILEMVCYRYAKYSAWALRNMTHKETPWLESKPKQVISKESIKEFFSIKLKYEEFNFDLERMEQAINSGFVEMPSNLNSPNEIGQWLSSVVVE